MQSRPIDRSALPTLFVFLCCLPGQSVLAERRVYSPIESEWSFLPGSAEASTPDPTSWRQPVFDDRDWTPSRAPIGYGLPVATDLEALVPPMRNNYSSFFVRREFVIPEKVSVVELHMLLNYDDGIIVWINGDEAFRDRVPGEPGTLVPHDETATQNHPYNQPVHATINGFAASIVEGANIIAVQVFNNTIRSSDVYFDLELFDPVAPDRTPPVVAQILPPPGTTLSSLTAIEVLFNEPVAGIDADDLQIGGQSGESVDGSGAGPYLFEFEQPAAGAVEISWVNGHGILDLSPRQNAFEGGSWSYTVDAKATLPRIVINELLAANGVGIVDEDDGNEDWIEILNLENFPVNLEGWSLTDDPENPGKWLLPSFVVAPGEVFVVFASGKDRIDANGELHTNFQLDIDGEYLGLYTPEIPRQVSSELHPMFPPQHFDHSYGRLLTGELAYFSEPTPGEINGDHGYPGFVDDPIFGVEHGHYDQPFPLDITTQTPEATIYYTLDGDVPTPENGLAYTEPVVIDPDPERGGAVTLRAIAYRDDLLPSRVTTATYIFLDEVLKQGNAPEGFPPAWVGHRADYGLDPAVVQSDPELALEALVALPTLSIVTDVDHLFSRQTGIYANPPKSGIAWERPTSAELIFPDGRKGFQIDCGIRMQGRANTMMWYTRKISMRLLFKGDYGATKLRFPLFPDYHVTQFDTLIIDAGMNNTWGNPNRDDQQKGQLIRDQYTADLQNETGGYAARGIFVHVYLNGLYWGVYYIHERNDASWGAENFGCNKRDYDVVKHQQGNLVNGSRASYDDMILRSRERLLDPEKYAALGDVLDFHNLADYTLINFYTGNIDWGHQNWYSSRKRAPGHKWLFHSWDAERTLETVGDNATGRQNDGAPTGVFQNLRRNPEFRLLVADHAHRLFFNGGIFWVDPDNPGWDPEHPERNRPAEIYNRRVEEISIPILMESARWGDMQRPRNSYKRSDWQRELQRLLTTYFPRRSRIVLGQLATARLYPRTPAPSFNQHGGDIEPGFVLTMEPEGRPVYYTLNGADPRLVGGEVSPSAHEYVGPVTLEETTLVKARTLDGEWSALNEATFSTTTPSAAIVLSEIMYNPAGNPVLEFVELTNVSATAVDISESSFTNGIAFTFANNTVVGPGVSIVLVANRHAFTQRYPDVDVFGEYQGRLDNAGEKVTLKSTRVEDNTHFSVEYNDASFWPLSPDGFGHSLVLDDVDGDPDDPRSWRASADVGGSPGESDPAPAASGVLVNEVLTSSSEAQRNDFIELANVSGESVDVSGWFLSPTRDNVDSLGAFRIPERTVIPAGGFVSFRGSEYNFFVETTGGGVYLSSANAAGELTGLIVGAQFGASEAGVAFGRYETSNGVVFTAMEAATPGRKNSLPQPPQVVINEIHYHPIDDDVEFVELYNPTDQDVNLAGWKLSGVSAADGQGAFTFADGVTLRPNDYLLAVPTDEPTFRAEVALPEGVLVFGPYGGGLDNAGERLRLFKPAGATVSAGKVLVDTIRFNDRAPWPTASDGTGPTLERIRSDEYGNEVLNWASSRPSGGTPGAENSVIDLGQDVPGQIPGDLNQDGRVNITDAVVTLLYLFAGKSDVLPCDGGEESASNQALLDTNGDGAVDLSDPIHLLEYIFRRGEAHTIGTRCVALEGCPEVCPARPR